MKAEVRLTRLEMPPQLPPTPDVSAGFRAVPVLESPSRQHWADIRRRANSPFIIRGSAAGKMLSLCSAKYLRDTVGHKTVPVEYSVRGITRLDSRINRGRHLRKTMPLCDALAAIENTPVRGVTHYLSALEVSKWLPELLPDIEPPAVLGAQGFLGSYFFAGSDGSGAALHYDPIENYICVLKGAKEVLFLPPGQLRDLCATPIWQANSNMSRLKAHAVEDYALRSANAYRCVVEATDLIYLPRNWWHMISNRGLTFAISFCYQWPLSSLLRWRQSRLLLRLKLEQWFGE